MPSPATDPDRVRDLAAGATPPPPAFTCRVRAEPAAALLTPAGELDLETAPMLDGDLRALRDLGFETIVIDLRELTFIDTAGLQLLLRWAAAAARRGREFRLIPGADRVQLVLRLTGVLASLGLEQPGRNPPAAATASTHSTIAPV